jgi:hypothetical protein
MVGTGFSAGSSDGRSPFKKIKKKKN